MNMIADKCNRCGKVVIKHDSRDSSDMIRTNDSFLFYGDLMEGESGRPSLNLKEFSGGDTSHLYCPDCLLETVKEWVEKIKKRPSSKIPINHILPPGNKVFNCPLCKKQ